MKETLKKIIVTLLTIEARAVLRKYKPRIVAVTGSVGKTSTKDAIFTVLASSFYVRKSQKSYNSEIGIPLTVLGCDNAWSNPFLWIKNIFKGLSLVLLSHRYPEWLVLEVGADHPGDIARVVEWLHIDVAVLTAIGSLPVHVEFYESREQLIREKEMIAHGLKDQGLLVLNNDDPDVAAQKNNAGRRVMTYGFESGADITASHDQITYSNNGDPDGITFKVSSDGNVVPIILRGVLGRQHIYPVLAAITVGEFCGVNIVAAGKALLAHEHAPGRMCLLEGIHESVLIDDSYNASPIAVHEAFVTLKNIETEGRKIIVLGDMMELGRQSVEAHRAAGMEASGFADLFVTVGVRARNAAGAALENAMRPEYVVSFDTSIEAGDYLKGTLQAHDVVLIKGSQFVRMEKTVAQILAHPEKKKDLLVRQDDAWMGR